MPILLGLLLLLGMFALDAGRTLLVGLTSAPHEAAGPGSDGAPDAADGGKSDPAKTPATNPTGAADAHPASGATESFESPEPSSANGADGSEDPELAGEDAADPGEDGTEVEDPEGSSDERVTPIVEPIGEGGDRFARFPSPRLAKGPYVVPRGVLAQRVQALLAGKGLAGAKIGIAIVSAADGATLYEKDADTPLIVASNNKLFTSAAALCFLGPDFQFTTRVYARGSFEHGAIDGDLVVVADGDPDIVGDDPTEAASLVGRLTAALVKAGVKSVSGDVVIDDSLFDREYLAPQWKKSQLSHDYAAPVAAFSLFENCLTVRVSPASTLGAKAAVTVLPVCSLLAPQIDVRTAGSTSKNTIAIDAPVVAKKVRVSGKTPLGKHPVPLFVPLANPGETHPAAIREALLRAGIAVKGEAKLATAPFERKGAQEIASVTTPLSKVLHKLGKESSNVLAEHVYKRTGAAREGKGTFASGGRAVLAAFGKLGIDSKGAQSADGSGLSRGNEFTARQAALLLRAMWNGDSRQALIDELPIAGVDGTLSKRLTHDAYKGRVRAKTGYISGVSALSGYAATDSGDVMCFSVIVNGVKGATAAKGLQDGIAKLLVDIGPKTP